MPEELWTNAALAVVNAGEIPIPVADTVLERMWTVMNAEQPDCTQIFDKTVVYRRYQSEIHAG